MLFELLASVALAAGSTDTVKLAIVATNTIKKENVEYMYSPKVVGKFPGANQPCVFELRILARDPKKFENTWSTPVQYAISDGRAGYTDIPGVSEFSEASGEVRLTDSRGGTYVVEGKSGRLISPSQPVVYGAKSGFTLTDVAPTSIYEKLGLVKGDTIVALNGVIINSPGLAKSIGSKLQKVFSCEPDIYSRRSRCFSRFRIEVECCLG